MRNEFTNDMTRVEPVSAVALDVEEPDGTRPAGNRNWRSVWIELVSLPLIGFSLIRGIEFWQNLFTSIDRSILVVGILAGLVIALVRATWWGEGSKWRTMFAFLLWSVSLAFIGLSFDRKFPVFAGLPQAASGLAIAGWCALRVRGETLWFAMCLGGSLMIPTAIEFLESQGAFRLLETFAAMLTSGLSDTFGLFNMREENTILFAFGVANRFSCLGSWDSVTAFLAIGTFCLLSRRRSLLSGTVTLVVSILGWLAVRAVAWVILAHLGARSGSWYDWTPVMEIACLAIGGLLIIGLDQFFGSVFEPIPHEFVNADFPLFAMGWNWLCGLPTLVVTVPQRETDFGPMEEEDE